MVDNEDIITEWIASTEYREALARNMGNGYSGILVMQAQRDWLIKRLAEARRNPDGLCGEQDVKKKFVAVVMRTERDSMHRDGHWASFVGATPEEAVEKALQNKWAFDYEILVGELTRKAKVKMFTLEDL